jgi:hypothetical protein
MGRLGRILVLGLAAVTACAKFRDTFTSHSETAARVGSQELKSATVAEIITRLGGPNASPDAAGAIAGIWVDFQLFGGHIASKSESDSVLMERLIWPQAVQYRISAWHDTLLAHRSDISAAGVDSAYNGDELRMFQHILVRPAGATASDTAKAKAEIERIAQQARTGDFGKLAKQYSADPANKEDGGYLPPSPRGQFVPEFESAAWGLKPGEVSGVVATSFGWHVIRRPPLSEARARFEPAIRQRNTARQDSLFIAHLLGGSNVEIKSSAAETIRKAAKDLPAAARSSKVIASYKGGELKASDLSRWLSTYPTQTLSQIQEAADTLLTNMVKYLVQNELLLKQADSAGVTVSPMMRQNLVAQMQNQIHDLKVASGLDAPELADTAKTAMTDRKRIAAEKIDEYFRRLTTNQAQFRPVPPILSAELRARGDFKIYDSGIAKAIELVSAAQRRDSTNRPPQAPGLQPAPGGPPTPNGRVQPPPPPPEGRKP